MKYQSGNVLFVILIAVALFAALSYAVSQSSTGTQSISDESISLKVDQVLEFGQNVKSAVHFIYTENGISESDIRFAHPDLSASYGDPSALNEEQMVFHPSGGGVTYRAPPSGINDGTDWFFTGVSCVSNVGTGMTGACGGAGASASELIAILPNVTEEACIKINEKLGVTNTGGNPPQDDVSSYDIATNHYAGTFSATYSIASVGGELDGKTRGCYESDTSFPASGTYHFYQVLLER